MDARSGRSSGLAAVAVVFVAVLVWWWFGGNGPMTPLTNSERLSPPDVDATGAPGASPTPQRPLADTVRIDEYELASPRRLVLTYTTGTPECVGTLETPEVVETDAAVTVTLRLDPEDRPAGPCREIALVERVAVDLDVPLGDRAVLDGALPRQQRVPPAR